MIVAESHITLASSSIATSKREVSESLRMWVGDRRPDFEGTGAAVPASAQVTLSEAGKAAQAAAQSAETEAVGNIDDAVENDPRMRLLKIIIEYMTGRKITLLRAKDLAAAHGDSGAAAAASAAASAQAPQRAGFGVEYDYRATYSESSSMSFEASGVIRTADGKEIGFTLSLTMQHRYSEETNVSLRAGDAKKIDPLILNFSGTAAQLSDQKFSFDLDADGNQERISVLLGGGFLALDRNGDGKINDGRELFGPASGNGFAELAALDDDGNGWIDENDAAYARLRVWTGGDAPPLTLKQANVGALYLGHVSSPFDIRNAQNQLQGQVRASGLWLSEGGTVGSMQQIDLVA